MRCRLLLAARCLTSAMGSNRHRRILYAMQIWGLPQHKIQKVSTVVGECWVSIPAWRHRRVMNAMANSRKTLRPLPLVLGQGNFGSLDGDPPAANCVTRKPDSALSGEMLRDLDKETVSWRPNYDSTRKEPDVLPAAAPKHFIERHTRHRCWYGDEYPPHNLGEVVDATTHLIENLTQRQTSSWSLLKAPTFRLVRSHLIKRTSATSTTAVGAGSCAW